MSPALVDWARRGGTAARPGIVLVGGGADDALNVYKRLPDILAARRLDAREAPSAALGVSMASGEVYDPYKG